MLEQLRKNINKQDDGLGPGAYNMKLNQSGPFFKFGTRFNSSVRSTNHINPTKVDGPGPGAYKMPSSIRVNQNHPKSVGRTTFGTSGRQYSDLPKDLPAPNQYRPVVFTKGSFSYTIPRPPEIDSKEIQISKQRMLPGPGSYSNMKDLKDQM